MLGTMILRFLSFRSVVVSLFVANAVQAASSGPEIVAGPYKLTADSEVQAGVPKGREEKVVLPTSKIFAGADHECWVYVPAQYDAAKPACVMIFQDGGGYVNREGGWRVPVVFDNLIARGEMPVTVGVFINPGEVKPVSAEALPRYNRSFEYDGLGDGYARFLLEEVLPEIQKKYPLSQNPDDRALAGASSGAVCAFTAAWERPDAFRRVFSTIGTYVSLRGANVYPSLIRKMAPKPLRVYLQDGINDQNIYGGDWWMANLEMERSLTFAGYEVNHIWGDGAHDGGLGGQILPEALRWLWKDHGKSPVASHPELTKQPVTQWADLASGWEVVGSGYKFAEGPCANAKGEVFFTDGDKGIQKIGLDGKIALFAKHPDGPMGLAFGPGGTLYAGTKGNIVSFDAEAKATQVATGFAPNDLVVTHSGNIYATEFKTGKVWLIPAGGQPVVVDEGIRRPNGVVLSPDQSLLYVADTEGQFVWSFQITAEGKLTNKQQYFHLHLADNALSNADGMCVDKDGRLYVATSMGVQICDPAGRVNAIIPKPEAGWFANVDFGGEKLDYLYATAHDKVFRHKMKVTGFRYADVPFKPEKPRL